MNAVLKNNDKIRKMSPSKSNLLLKIIFIAACCSLIFFQNVYAVNKVATGMTHTIAITTLNKYSHLCGKQCLWRM
jgi:hypothetical protein